MVRPHDGCPVPLDQVEIFHAPEFQNYSGRLSAIRPFAGRIVQSFEKDIELGNEAFQVILFADAEANSMTQACITARLWNLGRRLLTLGSGPSGMPPLPILMQHVVETASPELFIEIMVETWRASFAENRFYHLDDRGHDLNNGSVCTLCDSFYLFFVFLNTQLTEF